MQMREKVSWNVRVEETEQRARESDEFSAANNELNRESYRCVSDTKETMVGVIAEARNGANAIPIFTRPSVFLSTE